MRTTPSCSTRPISQSARRRPTGRYVAPVVGPLMICDPTSDFNPCTPQAKWSLRCDYCDAPSRVLRSRALEHIERLKSMCLLLPGAPQAKWSLRRTPEVHAACIALYVVACSYIRLRRRHCAQHRVTEGSTPQALRTTPWPDVILIGEGGLGFSECYSKH